MKKDKILNTSLAKLIKKYSQTDVIFTMERDVKNTPVVELSLEQIYDNHYLSDYSPSAALISNLVEAFKVAPTIEPIIVRPFPPGYEVVVGRKRLIAAKLAGLKTIPALTHAYTDQETLLVLLAIARDEHQVNPLEVAIVCHQLSQKFDYSQMALAELTHLSRSQITNVLRLLKLPKSVLFELQNGNITYGHARALVTLPERLSAKALRQIMGEKLNVRDTETLVSILKGRRTNPDLADFENKHHARVGIEGTRVIIDFDRQEDLDEVYPKILKI